MKKTEKFDYLINAGKTKGDLRPLCAYKNKDDAIEGAQRCSKAGTSLKYFEVVYMPEDDVDINKVVWANFTR